jgi:hypothetical protein
VSVHVYITACAQWLPGINFNAQSADAICKVVLNDLEANWVLAHSGLERPTARSKLGTCPFRAGATDNALRQRKLAVEGNLKAQFNTYGPA